MASACIKSNDDVPDLPYDRSNWQLSNLIDLEWGLLRFCQCFCHFDSTTCCTILALKYDEPSDRGYRGQYKQNLTGEYYARKY